MTWSLDDCKVLELPGVHDPRGGLTFLEGGKDVPFDIRRVYYLYDIPAGTRRAAHAHRALRQVYIALAGSLDVVLYDGRTERRITLSRPDQGLYLCPMIWRHVETESPGAVLLVLASDAYDESDYIRDRSHYESLATGSTTQ